MFKRGAEDFPQRLFLIGKNAVWVWGMLSKRRTPLTRREKTFFAVTTLLCIGVVIFAYMSATPQINISAPAPLPAQNADAILAGVQTSTLAAQAAIDPEFDNYRHDRTNEEKAWLYSSSRRKAWLKANVTIGTAINMARRTPYRYSIKRWDYFWNPKTSFSAAWVSPYKRIEARLFLSEKQTGQALNNALDLVELGGKVTHGSIWKGRKSEKDFIESASGIVQESLESANEADLLQATQRMQRLLDDRESYEQFLRDWRNRDLFLVRALMTGSPKVTSDDFLLNRDYQWRHFYENEEDKTPRTSYYMISKHKFVEEIERAFESANADSKKPFGEKSSVVDVYYLRNLKSDFNDSRRTEALILIQRRFLLLALALQRYKVQHGQFPKNLAQLSPEILESLPIDPYSAIKNTFGFKSNGKDYLLYSVGYNSRDDSRALSANYSKRLSTAVPTIPNGDDITFSRKSENELLIPTGTVPKKPTGLPPLYEPSPFSRPIGTPPPPGSP